MLVGFFFYTMLKMGVFLTILFFLFICVYLQMSLVFFFSIFNLEFIQFFFVIDVITREVNIYGGKFITHFMNALMVLFHHFFFVNFKFITNILSMIADTYIYMFWYGFSVIRYRS